MLETRPFRVIANVPIALETSLITLAPDDEKPVFSFHAGQWVGVKLPHDPIPTRRTVAFSIASAPIESTHAIELAIKVYGSFSRMMQTLNIGDRVILHGPFGVFTLQKDAQRIVYFAGGIGVTPLRSLIRHMLLTDDAREIILFYSNRTPNSTAFEDEFRALAETHKQFKPIFLYTGEARDGWIGEMGRIDRAIFDRHVPDVANAEFYMCGPRPFMETVSQILIDRGVDIKTKLHRELFG